MGLLKTVLMLTGLAVSVVTGAVPSIMSPAFAAAPSKPTISEEASAAVAQMGKTLLADQYSFRARTMRVYVERNGQPLHIGHTMKVVLHRPDKLSVNIDGDDGSTRLFYDGKTVTIYGVETKKYATVPVPATIQGMLETLMGKLGVDFPLADFLTNAPEKSFLSDVTSGREVNTVTIDGVPCRHLLFTQRPGIEIELWLEQNDKALPRRLVATYRSERGQPSFIAEMSDWDFSIHPSDADFTFQPPQGATQVELKPVSKTAASKPTGAKP